MPSLRHLAAVLLAATALTACAGGQYSPTSAAKPILALKHDAAITTPVPVHLPRDPARVDAPAGGLRKIVAQGIANSPLVRQAVLGGSKAGIGILQAESARWGNVNLTGGVGASDQQTHYITGHASLGLEATWRIFDGGKTDMRSDAAKQQTRAAVAQMDERLDLVGVGISEVVSDVERTRSNATITAAEVSNAERLLRLARGVVEAKTASPSDVSEAETAVAEARKRLVELERARTVAEARFARQVGFPAPSSMVIDYRYVGSQDTEAEVAKAVAQYPSMRIAEAYTQAAVNNALAIDAEAGGELALRLSGAHIARAVAGLNPIGLGLAIVQASLPLYDGGERQARFKAAVADIEIALAQHADVKRAIEFAVRESVAARVAAAKTAKIEASRLKSAQATLTGREAEYKQGTAGIKSLIDASTALFAARRAVVDAEATEWFANIRVAATQGVLATSMGLVDVRQVDLSKTADPFPGSSLLAPEPKADKAPETAPTDR